MDRMGDLQALEISYKKVVFIKNRIESLLKKHPKVKYLLVTMFE